jgi:uncharacterized membrane protein YadS
MSSTTVHPLPSFGPRRGVPGLFAKEDWWAVWLGLGLVLASWALAGSGMSLRWLAVTPPRWTSGDQLAQHFAAAWPRYVGQFGLWLALFGGGIHVMGGRFRRFAPAFTLLYLGAVAVMTLGAWDAAQRYNLEAPLVALAAGLLIANLAPMPRWMDAGFRVEFFIKTGIVLLGATLPFSLIVWGGPIAILQAGIVSVATFMTIYVVGRALNLDPRLAAVLGAGGAVCGVSAVIAIAAAVRAKKEHPPIAITQVILWALVMIFLLPVVCRWLELPTGVAGAFIGTSEFADAAGFAAAQSYGGMAAAAGLPGTPDQALFAYTLVKVVGRDIWIGIWALVLSLVAMTQWEARETGGRVDGGQLWARFPKFVFGFLAASLIVTLASTGVDLAEYDRTVKPVLVAPLSTLRAWAFVLSFLSIGLTTRLRDLAPSGGRPFVAFASGVVVNLALGWLLSTQIFYSHWAGLTR